MGVQPGIGGEASHQGQSWQMVREVVVVQHGELVLLVLLGLVLLLLLTEVGEEFEESSNSDPDDVYVASSDDPTCSSGDEFYE